ncbi:glucose 1-dehydrogenase [Penicillium paradoxum]|uniref:glucose 1-dehydrogenase n=1 Tax=Penicillium paradoxum TaxID=176176 RepID=UPI002548BECD|nr:glucose 1-dehydrogenase [Penicillium paradoxum]KAJ5774831.1 glucose 1-dehydrogenase [Penicillium paradoxum]
MSSEVAFITGAASGVGKAVATQLASKGIKVFIADRDAARAAATAQEINGAYAVVDVSSWDSQAAAFQQALDQFGRVDYVLAGAGIGENQWIPDNTATSGFEKPQLSVIDVNVTGMLYTVSLAVQHFRRQPLNEHGSRGKVIITGSVCGIYCCPGLPIYTTSKHAVTGLVRSWGKALPSEGITLNSVNPNVIRTNISTAEFYDSLEAEGLLTPIHGVVEICEQLLSAKETASGECYEIGPNYDAGQGAVHPKFPDFIDEKQKIIFDKLAERGQAKRALQQSEKP